MTSSTNALITVAAYDARAAAYAEHSRDRAPMAGLHARFVELAGANARVLDLGCGPAHDAAELTARGCNIVGIDPARGLLLEARRYDSLTGLLVQGDARRLPFASGVFDAIWSCASLLHIPHDEVDTAIAEAFRVLRRGGVLFTSLSEGEETGAVPVESDGLARRLYYYHREQDWASRIRAAGFEIIDHQAQRQSGNFNPGSTGWIETFARKP
jgi:SAM-dependent methyltransferase